MYELPRAISARLQAAARGLRNADAVLKLATFLARWHTGPKVIGRPFTVDRVALAGVEALGLSASQVRGALAALDRLGFLERHEVPGSRYRRTEHGLRRKPVLWRIALDFLALFERANKVALAKLRPGTRRYATVNDGRETRHAARPAPPLVARKETPAVSVLSGEQRQPLPDTPFEAAVRALQAGVFGRHAGGT